MTTASTLRVGQVLFRFRSFTPVPVLVGLSWLLYRSRGWPGPGGAGLDAALDVVGLLVAALGQLLRFYTLAWVPEGTSGQRDVLEAQVLNTRGPYAFVRNPLYVGNLGICLGLMLIAHDGWVYLGGLAFFFGEYFFIIRAEENFLRGRFGQAFDDYCAHVRRWVPRLTAASSGRLRDGGFDWKRSLKKEHNPLAAWGTGAIALMLWERWARGELTGPWRWSLLGLELALVVFFAVTKAWKRRWI